MNTKLLIPVLLSTLSGCSVAPSVDLAQEGGGGGATHVNVAATPKTQSVAINTEEVNLKAKQIIQGLTQKVPFERVDDVESENNKFALETGSEDEPEYEEREILVETKRSTQHEFPAYNGQPPNGKPMLKLPKPSSAGNPSEYQVAGSKYKVLPFSNGFVEKGIASWYGADFHGEKTSNGEIYDMHGMTAAHKRLPIPSYVKVTNLKNKRSVILRINDRGPFHADRVIDLSYAAAQKLDIHQVGTEQVKIEAIKTPRKESVYLQLGVFSNPVYAQLLQKKVAQHKMPAPMIKEITLSSGKAGYRVQLGPVFSKDKVEEFNQKLEKMGISETWYVTENKVN